MRIDDDDRRLEEFLKRYLSDNSFEDLLEELDLTTLEVFCNIYYNGLINEKDLEERFPRYWDE